MAESAVSRASTFPSITTRAEVATRSERRLFWLGAGAVSLHVLDDSFLQPEPGTSPGDHLVSGLVPLTAIALIAVAYPRWRAGVRAPIAMVLGLLGIVAGTVEGVYHTVTNGLSGDDYTALLSLLGGLGLVVLGAVDLWRTRRLDESHRRRYLRRALVAVAAAVVGFEVVFPLLFSYGYTHFGRSFVPHARLGARVEDVSFRTSDGLRLAGWYVPSRNGAAVIVLPASGRNGPQDHVRMLVRHGYGVLIFDPRGTGQSQGDPYRWGGDRDVKAAVTYLKHRSDVDPERIGGLGLSLGGELMLETAGETDALKAVVSEGAGIRSVHEAMEKPGALKWLSAPFWATSTAAIAVFSNHAPPPDLKELVARISPRPVFFIYSGHPVGGEELNAQFYAAAGEPKTLWKIADAGHTGGLSTHPREYERRVVGFFDQALLR